LHLSPEATEANASFLEKHMRHVKPWTSFDEERRPAPERTKDYEKLVVELSTRLDLERLGSVLKRKARTPRRRRMVLRRLRDNVGEYCTVVKIPLSSQENTFTPFMLPRVEALVGATLRFMNRHR
jgi:hypothetical protein